MGNTSNKSLIGMGFAGDKLVEGNLIPFCYCSNNPFVWILSSNISPQPSNKYGIWFDDSLWNDSAVWYD